MIVRVTGVLEDLDDNAAIVAAADGSLAREVLIPSVDATTLATMLSEQITLHTIEVYEGAGAGTSLTPRLMGFLSKDARAFFSLLTTVKGIGPKKALKAMASPVGSIAGAIEAGDAALLKTLPQISARLAESMVAQLKGKAGPYAAKADNSAAEPAARAAQTSADAPQVVEALVRLGEQRPQAERLVEKAVAQAGESAGADELLAAAFALRS